MSDLDTARLSAWLTRHLDGFEGPSRLERLSGGQSNPTYRLESRSGTYALRRKPFGPILPSAHAIEREHRLLSALHPAGFPTPRPLALCEDPEIIGAAFYVMAFTEGRSFLDGRLPDQTPDERRALYESLIDTLATLHAIDPKAVGLSDYGRDGDYFQRQIARWTRQYRASQTDDIAEIEKLIDFLGRTAPAQTRSAIIHGDYRIDNLIYAADGPAVAAVIDWELSTLGDPLADFTYLAMNWTMEPDGRSGLLGVDFAATGIPTLEAATARYCARTGLDELPDLSWYFAYNLFRLTCIVQGIRKRLKDGNAAGHDAEATAARLLPLARAAWVHAREAGAAR